MRMIVCAFLTLAACAPAAEKADAPPPAVTAAAQDVATVEAPLPNARVTSPLVVSGIAPKNWYFEAIFPAALVDANGAEIASAPANAQTDWTAPGNDPIRFRSELTFNVTQDTPATLVLQEDMPGDNATPREVRVPVVLAPN